MEQGESIKLTDRQNFIQGLKFVLFSFGAGIIQTLTFTLLNELVRWPYWPSYLIALVLSVLYNFTVNRRFTFKSAKNVPLAMAQVFGYYLIFTPLSTWWGDALTKAGWNEYIVLVGTMVINLITEFCFCRFVVYRDHMFTNEAGRRELERDDGSEGVEGGSPDGGAEAGGSEAEDAEADDAEAAVSEV